MYAYFQLQGRMLNRRMVDFGIHPLLGYPLLILVFTAFSVYLFYQTSMAAAVYLMAAGSALYPLGEPGRNDFLKSVFPKKEFNLIRSIENLAVSLPFLLFLLFRAEWLAAAILSPAAVLFARIDTGKQASFTLPTPFSKKPYEFPAGFRHSIWPLGFACFLCAMACMADNFNLGVFSLVLVFLITLSYYAQPEPEYFVWMFQSTPRQFLIEKIRTALWYATFLTLPVLLVLSGWFGGPILILLAFQVLGYLALSTIILAKYSAYPQSMSVPQGFLLALSIQFPPLLLLAIPLFYRQSVRRLQWYLSS